MKKTVKTEVILRDIVKNARWVELLDVVPGLKQLEKEVSSITDNGGAPYFCANEIWYGYNGNPSIKARMERLVGFYADYDAEHLGVSTHEAYETVYRHLYENLPGCRNCGCF